MAFKAYSRSALLEIHDELCVGTYDSGSCKRHPKMASIPTEFQNARPRFPLVSRSRATVAGDALSEVFVHIPTPFSAGDPSTQPDSDPSSREVCPPCPRIEGVKYWYIKWFPVRLLKLQIRVATLRNQ
jgi:hypothetical protein